MLSLCVVIFDNIRANKTVGMLSLCTQKYLHIPTDRIADGQPAASSHFLAPDSDSDPEPGWFDHLVTSPLLPRPPRPRGHDTRPITASPTQDGPHAPGPDRTGPDGNSDHVPLYTQAGLCTEPWRCQPACEPTSMAPTALLQQRPLSAHSLVERHSTAAIAAVLPKD